MYQFHKFDKVLKAMKDVGLLLKDGLKSPRTFSTKEHQHYLTQFDIEADTRLHEVVKKAYPTHIVHSEESDVNITGSEADNTNYYWYIDPISNTRNFIHGLHGFAVAVGVIHNAKPVIGAVYDPILDEMFIGQVGHGAYLNDKLIKPSNFEYGEHAYVSVDWQKRRGKQKIKEGLKIVTRVSAGCTLRTIGSAALTACYVAAGRIEVMVTNYADYYAMVAAWPIVQEAGAQLCDLTGKIWSLNSESTLVTNTDKTAKGVLRCLKK